MISLSVKSALQKINCMTISLRIGAWKMSEINKLYYEQSHTNYYMSRLSNVLEWLQSKDSKANLSRYSRYKAHIDDFYKSGNPNDLADLEQKFKKLNEAAQEIFQIVEIYEEFKSEDSKGFNERIKKIISGSDFHNSQNTADQPRDFLYELLVASWFHKNGYTIDFDKSTDVVATKDDIVVYIECKRIKSINKLEQNLKKACKQLSEIDDENHFGLVFVDVFNCIADKVKDHEYSNVTEINTQMNSIYTNAFAKPNAGLIDSILTDNLGVTLGAVFTCARCLWLKNITPQFYRGIHAIASQKIEDENFKMLKKILEKK